MTIVFDYGSCIRVFICTYWCLTGVLLAALCGSSELRLLRRLNCCHGFEYMCIYICHEYVYMYTYIHACMHACMHTYRQTDIHTCANIHVHMYAYECVCMFVGLLLDFLLRHVLAAHTSTPGCPLCMCVFVYVIHVMSCNDM